eukprot:4349-Eustigmatos_ZCMA.PRE.1
MEEETHEDVSTRKGTHDLSEPGLHQQEYAQDEDAEKGTDKPLLLIGTARVEGNRSGRPTLAAAMGP